MSNASEKLRLQDALLITGQSGRLYRFWGPEKDRKLDRICSDLEEFYREYAQRFGERPDPYELLKINQGKWASFFHVDTLIASVDMKLVVWRILLGCEIERLEFKYEAGQPSLLKVTLRPPNGHGKEEYTSRHFADFRVLRHFGASGVNDQLTLSGYYAVPKSVTKRRKPTKAGRTLHPREPG